MCNMLVYNFVRIFLMYLFFSTEMEEAMKNGFSSQMVDIFCSIKNTWESLRTSKCKNLVEYIKKTMIYWHDVLKEKFGR